MALELSTAGVTLQYAVETASGTRPTTGYTIIPNIKSIPDFNPAPNSIQVTDLSETEFHRYILGLRDLGGSIEFLANHTEAFHATWDALVEEYEEALDANLAMWFAVVIPNLSKAFYFIGQPSSLGLASITVDTVLETNAYIAPNKVEGWRTKHTA